MKAFFKVSAVWKLLIGMPKAMAERMVQFLTAPLLAQLPVTACPGGGAGSNRELPHMRNLDVSSRLLASGWPSSAYCRHL